MDRKSVVRTLASWPIAVPRWRTSLERLRPEAGSQQEGMNFDHRRTRRARFSEVCSMNGTVFQVIDTLRIGGAERLAVDVSNALTVLGWEVHLIGTRELGPLEDEVSARVHVLCLHRTSRWDPAGLRDLRRLIVRHRPHILHAHGWSSMQFAAAGLLGLRDPPALVFHDHRGAGFTEISAWDRIAAWLSISAHVVVDPVLLESHLRTRRRSFKGVVTNGSPMHRSRCKLSYELLTPPRIAVVANLRPEKGHLFLLEALSRLAADGLPLEVDLIGATPDVAYERAVRAQIASLGLDASVRVVGPRRDVCALLADYDIGVLSSLYESGPIALIEYLAAGLPFVATDVGEVPASLPPSLRRWVVAPGDVPALAARLQEVLALSTEGRAATAAEGVAFAREHLSIERTVGEIETVYDRVRRG